MPQIKILVTNQKGGVGKSTLSANLAGYLSLEKKLSVSFIDFDKQSTSYNLIKKYSDHEIAPHKAGLIYQQNSNLTLLEARSIMRTRSGQSDVVIADLTWTFGLPDTFLLDFDIVIVPSSNSVVEVASTEIFLLEYYQKNSIKFNLKRQYVIVTPSRIDADNLSNLEFEGLRFIETCSVGPVVYRIPHINEFITKGFLCHSDNPVVSENFLEFGDFVYQKIEQKITESQESKRVEIVNKSVDRQNYENYFKGLPQVDAASRVRPVIASSIEKAPKSTLLDLIPAFLRKK